MHQHRWELLHQSLVWVKERPAFLSQLGLSFEVHNNTVFKANNAAQNARLKPYALKQLAFK